MPTALCIVLFWKESFQAEVQAKGGNLQVRPDQSQQTPVTVSVAPVEGKKWKRVSLRLERKKEEVEEEVEEDPGEGIPQNQERQKQKLRGMKKTAMKRRSLLLFVDLSR